MSDSSTNDDVAAGGVVIPLAIICVALRFYTRHITKAGYGWDDWLILCSVVVMIVAAALLLWGKMQLMLWASLWTLTPKSYGGRSKWRQSVPEPRSGLRLHTRRPSLFGTLLSSLDPLLHHRWLHEAFNPTHVQPHLLRARRIPYPLGCCLRFSYRFLGRLHSGHIDELYTAVSGLEDLSS